MYLNLNSTSRPTVPSSLTKVWISRVYNALTLPGRRLQQRDKGLWLIERESFFVHLIVNFIEIQHLDRAKCPHDL